MSLSDAVGVAVGLVFIYLVSRFRLLGAQRGFGPRRETPWDAAVPDRQLPATT